MIQCTTGTNMKCPNFKFLDIKLLNNFMSKLCTVLWKFGNYDSITFIHTKFVLHRLYTTIVPHYFACPILTQTVSPDFSKKKFQYISNIFTPNIHNSSHKRYLFFLDKHC
jgi:hypothetical protein